MYQKIVLTGGIVEVFQYEHLNIRADGGNRTGDGENHQENYKQRQRIRRNKIRQLICSNFDSGSKFVTLTFADRPGLNVKDVQQCNSLFKVFIQRLRRRYPDLLYVSVIEFQDKFSRGAVHYHMVCNLPYISAAELRNLWQNGFIKINRIEHVDNIGAYVIKYMTADMDDERLCGQKAYLRSRGLSEPVEVCSWRDNDLYDKVSEIVKEKSPTYCSEYISEYAGTVRYFQYNMVRTNEQVKKII